MTKLALAAFLLLVVALLAPVEAMPQQPTSTAPHTCMANSTPVKSRGDANCVLNCANYSRRSSMVCTDILHIGNFCNCAEGYVFKSGTEGECVRMADCGK